MDRREKKKEIIEKLTDLLKDLNEYMELWKISGGGTTGYAIGSATKRLSELITWFENKC